MGGEKVHREKFFGAIRDESSESAPFACSFGRR